MKEATGELNMTVVTLIAIAAIGALFYAFIWPMVQRTIVQQTCKTYGPDYKATTTATGGTANCICADDQCASTSNVDTGSNADVKTWYCCKETTTTTE